MSAYKIRHPDDTDDPQDVGLSLDDEGTGMEEQIGVAQWITVSHPDRSVSPHFSQGRAATPPAEDQAPSTGTSGPSGEPPAGFVRLGPDEVVIKKAVLCGIKRGAKHPQRSFTHIFFCRSSQCWGCAFCHPKTEQR